jgi:hypothetical protein
MSFFHLTSLFWNEGGAYVFYAQSPVPGDCLRWMHSRRDAGAVRDTDTNPPHHRSRRRDSGIDSHRRLRDPLSSTIS